MQSDLNLDTVIRLLSTRGFVQTYEKGDLVFRQGDAGNSMFLIEDGEIGLIFDHGKESKVLSAGTFFGELALLSANHNRSATAVAASPCMLRVLGQDVFRQLVVDRPDALVYLLRETCSYLIESERKLMADLLTRNRLLEQTIDYLRRTKIELDSVELLAQTDELTGIYNRRCLEDQVDKYINEAVRQGTNLGLIILDIDNFKTINDVHGHYVGDIILKRLATNLRRTIRAADLPCRMGGDEFCVIMPRTTENESIMVGRRILKTVGSISLSLPHSDITCTSTLGGTLFRAGESWQEFYQRADQNLYFAKKAGRNQFQWDDLTYK